MTKILISLPAWQPAERTRIGELRASDDTNQIGPFECDGKSDNQAAIAAENPTRNPELPYGDTPFGEYSASIVYELDTPGNRRSYGLPDETGKIPTIALQPLKGPTQAWRAYLNRRTGLRIHSGDLNGSGGLRPTHGCVRMIEDQFKELLLFVKRAVVFGVSIVEQGLPDGAAALSSTDESQAA